MKEKNMTAFISLFVRAYHNKDKNIKVFNDKYADTILSKTEYEEIKKNLIFGIKFFNSNFKGNKEETIKWIINKQIGPSILGRSAFNKRTLDNAIKLGCKEYIVYASGYDSSTLDYNIDSFEIDKPEIIKDKIERIKSIRKDNIKYIGADLREDNWIDGLKYNNYKNDKISHSSFLGISYYLSKEEFSILIKNISKNICNGSSIVFDFQTLDQSFETQKNEILSSGANQEMKSKYSYQEIEKILSDNNLRIYEYLDDKQITNEFFYDYNTLNPDCTIIAPKGIAYILAVKK